MFTATLVRGAIVLAMALTCASALAQFGEPATLIIEAHSEHDGETNPKHTPNAAIRAAVAWSRVRHRVTLLVPDDVLEQMREKLSAELGADKSKGPTKSNLPTLVGYDSWKQADAAIRDWGYKFFEKKNGPPRAPFGIVHLLGHGAIEDGAQVLRIPDDGEDSVSLNIDGLCSEWRRDCVPVAVFLDVCRHEVDGDIADPPSRGRRAPGGVEVTDDLEEFVIEASEQRIPLEGTTQWITTFGSIAPRGQRVLDVPELLASSLATGLQVDGGRFTKIEQKTELTLLQLFEFASEDITGSGKQSFVPWMNCGILTGNHIVAMSKPKGKASAYYAPTISIMRPWAENLAFKENDEIKTEVDPETGAITITRLVAPTADHTYLYAADNEDYQLSRLFEPGRVLTMVVAANPGDQKAHGTIGFEVHFSQNGKIVGRTTHRVAIGGVLPIFIEDIPEKTDQLAIASIPSSLEQPIAKTWPAKAELHVLSMDISDSRARSAKPSLAVSPTEQNRLQFWYPRDVLVSNAESRVRRTSHALEKAVAFSFEKIPAGERRAFAGVGGPLYGQESIEQGDTCRILVKSSGKGPRKRASICILGNSREVLLADEVGIGTSRIEFKDSGEPQYLAIVAEENCNLTIESVVFVPKGRQKGE